VPLFFIYGYLLRNEPVFAILGFVCCVNFVERGIGVGWLKVEGKLTTGIFSLAGL
jgi:hypothetical protein